MTGKPGPSRELAVRTEVRGWRAAFPPAQWVAVLVSLLLMIRRAAYPHVAFLGRIPGTRSFSDLARNPDNEAIPGSLAFRVDASLLYFNVEHVRDAIWQKIRSTAEPPKLVVCDLSATPLVDLAGVRMLATLHAQLQAAGIRLRLAAARAKMRDILRAEGMEVSSLRFLSG